MKLETDEIFLRSFVLEDLEDVFEYCSYKSVGDMAGWQAVRKLSEAKEDLDRWVKLRNFFAIVYKKNEKVIGHINIQEDSEEGRSDTRELGFALHPDYQKRGLMNQAVKLIIAQLFSENVRYIWACCFKENIPSKKLIEKLGFVFQKEGSYYSPSLQKTFDSYEYCMSKEIWRKIRKFENDSL